MNCNWSLLLSLVYAQFTEVFLAASVNVCFDGLIVTSVAMVTQHCYQLDD